MMKSLVQSSHIVMAMLEPIAVSDCAKQCKIMKSAFDVVTEVSKLVRKSPKRGAMFDKIKAELVPEAPGF